VGDAAVSWSDIYKVGAATEAGAKVPAAPFGFDVRRAPGAIVGNGVTGWVADNADHHAILHPTLDFSQSSPGSLQAMGNTAYASIKSVSSTVGGGVVRGDTSQVFGKIASPVADGRTWTVFRVKSGDPNTDTGKRAHLVTPDADLPREWCNIGDEIWYAWQQYIPSDATGLKNMQPGENCSFGPVLHDFNLGSGLGGAIALRYAGAATSAACSRSLFISGSNENPANDEGNQAIWTETDYPVGAAETFVIRHKLGWDASHSPVTTIWRNGVQLATSTAMNAYRPDAGDPTRSHFTQWGLYCFNPPASGERVAMCSAMVIIKNQAGVTEEALRNFVNQPFDGVFFDTARGDSLLDLDIPVDASITASASAIDFVNAGADKDLNIYLKDGSGAHAWMCFDTMKVEATYTVNSFPAVDRIGFRTGYRLAPSITTRFVGQIKAHPSSTTIMFPWLELNSSLRVAGSSKTFTSGYAVRIEFAHTAGTATQTYRYGTDAPITNTKVMTLTATSDELPRLFSRPNIQFVSGSHSLTALKISASYPCVRFGFMGDSITQGRFATAFADGFPQLIRGDYPGQVLVAGAPSVLTGDWLNAMWAFVRMKPRYAFVLLGTNDISLTLSDAVIQANLTSIAAQLTAAGIEPIIMQILPRGSIRTDALNAWIAAQPWRSIDTYHPLIGTGTSLAAAYDSGDGLHPNTAGNLAIANIIRAYITAEGLP
jgi:acyl-CoA thioesterase-1